jgi:hypothetical protein
MGQGTGPLDDGDLRWSRTGEWELAARQLRAIAAFHHARAIAAWAAAAGERSRAMREQDARRLEILRRKHEAVIDRAHEQLRSSGVRRPPLCWRVRVVVADRRPDDELLVPLDRHGVDVLARVANGADAVGITLVEQPDVVVLSAPLDLVPADEVVRDVRRYSPETTIFAVTGTEDEARACAGAGATVVLPEELASGALVQRIVGVVEQRPGVH